MKRILSVFVVCVALLALASCGGDDGEENLLTPAGAVGNLAFTDVDPAAQRIGGRLSWELPSQEIHIEGYVVYLAGKVDERVNRLGEVPAGVTFFDVPAGTLLEPYLLVVARNGAGESTNVASVAVADSVAAVAPAAPRAVGAWILNRGSWNSGNASLAYCNLLEGVMIPDVYRTVNGRGLGDSAEQIVEYGSKVYVTVTTSNLLVVLDGTGAELKRFAPVDAGGGEAGPRGLAAYDGKVYVSYYYGHCVAVLDTASLTMGEKTAAVGRYPEAVAVADGKLYVANSGGLDFPDYGKTVSVVDLESLAVEREIEVLVNPTRLAADGRGDVYVISSGNYADVPNTLQRIDGATGAVNALGEGTLFAVAGDSLYVVYARYGDPSPSFRIYNMLTEAFEPEAFLSGGPAFGAVSAIAVDPVGGDIYIADAKDYVSSGALYVFSPEGVLKKSEDTGGPDPAVILLRVR